MADLLDWVENQTAENIRFRLQNAETLAKDAASLLTILLAGMGGSLAYAMKAFEDGMKPGVMTIGACGLSVWLMLTSVLLIVKCIMSRDLDAPTNEPKNLYRLDYSPDEIRKFELDNVQQRIERLILRNQGVAVWLDRARLMTAASPLILALTALVWAAL